MRQLWSRLKPYLRWIILGGTLFFLAATLRTHWQEVAAIRVDRRGWELLAIATFVTLLAHIWTGWVWSWILRFLNQPVASSWSIKAYLRTNVAKYLPGNVWHFYGRVWAAKAIGIPLETATLSVLLEPLLMAAAALMMTLISSKPQNWSLKFFSLVGVLMFVHPRVLNPVVQLLRRLKQKVKGSPDGASASLIQHYPLLPLVGELGFVGLRGAGFLLTFLALAPIPFDQITLLVGGFSFAWLLGLVVPGAPGGVGVFEVTAIALLNHHFPVALILSVVALYRLVSILAEAIGAGIAWLSERSV